MKKIIYIFGSIFSLLMIGCEKSEPIIGDKISLEHNTSILNARLNHKNAGLLNIKGLESDNIRSRNIASTSNVMLSSSDNNFAIALVSEVASPIFDGQTLRSTHVALSGDYAYVSYNTEGEKYLGGIDVINIADVNNPTLVVSAKLQHIDVNTLAVDGNKLLIAGAADRDMFNELNNSAWTSFLPLNNGLLSSDFDFTGLQGESAIEVIAGTSTANYVVSGSNGVLSKLNKQNGNVEVSINIPDLRSVRHNGSKVVVLSGTGILKVFNESLILEKNITVKPNILDSKRVLDMSQNFAFVPQGKDGFASYNIQSGTLLREYPIPAYLGNDVSLGNEDIVTNAVSINGDKLFVANGGAGVSIYNLNRTDGAANLLGTASFDGLELSSSNFVISREDYAFVANGRGGLKILKLIDLTPKAPTCTGSYPKYSANESWFNINSNDKRNFSGSHTFQGVNVGGQLIWCGTMRVMSSDLNVNSNGVFTLYGTLLASKSLNVNASTNLYGASLVEGNLNLNSNGTLHVIGNLSQGKSASQSTFHINGKLIIEGEVVVYGDLNLNSSGIVEFKNSQSKLIVYGRVTNNNAKILNGSITKI